VSRQIFSFLLASLLAAFSSSVNAQILPSFGGSRTGTTGMQFLKIGVDARSAGMAGTVSATVNDVSALYWNPAGISGMDTAHMAYQVSHTLYFADVNLSWAGVVFRRKQSYWGLSLSSLNSGDMKVTTEFQPFGTGQTFRVVDQTLGLTYAKRLTDNFVFGVTGRFAHEAIADVVTNNAVFDLGFQYDIGLANTRFAVAVSNFGFNVKPGGKLDVLRLNGPQTLEDFEKVSVPAIFRIGFAWDPIKDEHQQLTLTTQLNHPTDNNETLGLASEYIWNKILFARLGYEFGQDEKGLPAFGAGVQTTRKFGMLRFDYGYNNKERLGNVHRFTIGLVLR